MNKTLQPQWLEWAKELQFLAQTGLTYSKDVFDIERFERIREISAEIISAQSELSLEKVKDLFCNETGFQTPKLDTRAAIFKEDKPKSVGIPSMTISGLLLLIVPRPRILIVTLSPGLPASIICTPDTLPCIA